jgi:hypothetical protein
VSALMPWSELAEAMSCSVRTAKRRAMAARLPLYRIAGQQVARGIFRADFGRLVVRVPHGMESSRSLGRR